MKHIETLKESAEAWRDKYSNPGDFEESGQQEAYMAGAEWMRKQFTLHGTTDCRTCDNGRATLYATLDGECIGCAQSSGDTDK